MINTMYTTERIIFPDGDWSQLSEPATWKGSVIASLYVIVVIILCVMYSLMLDYMGLPLQY